MMNVVTNPKVKLLAEGKSYVAKEMAARAGVFLPKHLASEESVLVIQEGACVMHLEDSAQTLNQDDVFIVPAHVKHQIETRQDFRAVHVIPEGIEFEFFK